MNFSNYLCQKGLSILKFSLPINELIKSFAYKPLSPLNNYLLNILD